MPTKKLIRFWCHTCKEFTLQEQGGGCLTCGTINESYKLSEVPEEKLIAQRNRYSAKKKADIINAFQAISPYSEYYPISLLGTLDMYSEVVEDDAGQKAIDKAREERYEKIKKEREELKAEYNKTFKGTNRNESCPCGSGKKYKHCCQNKFSNLRF